MGLRKVVFLVLAITFLLYPGIFLFVSSPMVANSWTLQDMGAGLWALVPGRSVARHELLDNGNILWSSLRNMGAPILGNDVQAAPLFPLTFLLAWAPDPFFWNAFVAIRLVLMWVGAVLIGKTILKLDRMAAFVFAACFVGTVGVAHWLNHPWQSGLAAGIWLLYFVGRAFALAAMPWCGKRLLNTLGLAISTYALATCGFPEAVLLMVLIGVLVFTPMLIVFIAGKHPVGAPARLAVDLVSGGLTGVMLASLQLFALVENIWQAAPGFRSDLGLLQFSSSAQLLTMITRYGPAAPPAQMVEIYGLIPLTLVFVWILARLIQRRADLLDATAVVMIGFYLLKAFPLWSAFNRAIGSLPLLDASWFFVYFTPVGLFGFALLAARGATFIFSQRAESDRRQVLLVLVLSIIIVAVLVWAGAMRAQAIEARYLAPILFVFLLFLGFAGLAIFNPSSRSLVLLCSIGVVWALLQESALNRPDQFVAYRSRDYAPYADDVRLGRTIRSALDAKGIPSADVREASREGKYVSSGIATIDNGATAILTERAQLFRTGLFNTDWKGYLWLQTEKRKDAYRIAGRNIVTSQKAPDDTDTFMVLSDLDQVFVMLDRRSPGRAFVASRCRQVADARAALAIMSDEAAFRAGDVVVENATDAEAVLCARQDASWRQVGIAQDQGSRVRLANVQGPAIVTLNDSAYPGWRAFDRMSGAELAIRPGNLNFRTVFLPEARDYEIEFVYRPSWLWTALMLTAMAAVAWLGLAIATFARRPIRDSATRLSAARQ